MCPNYLEALSDNIRIDKDKCVFCGRCVERCILDNLRMNLAPCRNACPMGVNIQGYVQLILRGKDDEARAMVRETLPFPESVCMVCHHPCENACQRAEQAGPAVSIRALKRYLFDSPAGRNVILPEKAPASGQRVAVVGAGPAGLVAAYDLAVRGHTVHLLEADPQIGGLLRHGIPAFRLPQEMLTRELSILEKLGVVIRCGCRVGQDIPLDTLLDTYPAVIMAAGLGCNKKLGIQGEDMALEGATFLRDVRNGSGPELSGEVAVVGGGNAAMDTALTALRQGADSVRLISLEQADALPAFAHEVQQARNEGVLFDAGWGLASMVRTDTGIMITLEACSAVFTASGQFAPVFNAEQRKQMTVAHVIVAIGQQGDRHLLAESRAGAEASVDPLTLQYGTLPLFFAGEWYSGASSVIQAMAQGRKAAESAHRVLQGEDLFFNRAYAGPIITDFTVDTARGSDAPRQQAGQRLSCGKGDYNPVEIPLTAAQAQVEASRCYSCGGPTGHHRTCWFCLPCEVDCPEQAITVEIPYLLR